EACAVDLKGSHMVDLCTPHSLENHFMKRLPGRHQWQTLLIWRHQFDEMGMPMRQCAPQHGGQVRWLGDAVYTIGIKTVPTGQEAPVLVAFDNSRFSPLIEAVIPHPHNTIAIVVKYQRFDGEVILPDGFQFGFGKAQAAIASQAHYQ